MFRNAPIIWLRPQATLASQGILPQTGRDFIPPLRCDPRITAPTITNAELRARGAAPAAKLPTKFTWRTNKLIRGPIDQGTCGDCWACATTTALGDRTALVTKSGPNLVSARFLTTCDVNNSYGDEGCNGGHVDTGLNWMSTNAVPSYDCQPNAPDMNGSQTPPCKKSACSDGQTPFRGIYKVKPGSVRALKTIGDIKADLMANGPVPMSFIIPANFITDGRTNFSATKGLFITTDTQSKSIGGHAVVAVGWDVEPGPISVTIDGTPHTLKNVPYWIIRNSWGSAWGDGGFFKFAMTTQQDGIMLNQYCGLDTGNASAPGGAGVGGGVAFIPDVSGVQPSPGPSPGPSPHPPKTSSNSNTWMMPVVYTFSALAAVVAVILIVWIIKRHRRAY